MALLLIHPPECLFLSGLTYSSLTFGLHKDNLDYYWNSFIFKLSASTLVVFFQHILRVAWILLKQKADHNTAHINLPQL